MDLSELSNDELYAAAGISSPGGGDLSSLSDADLYAAAGIKAPSPNDLGPNYDLSFGANTLKGISDIPRSLWNLGGELADFVNPWANGGQGGPIDTIRRAGTERTAHTVGSLATGLAGAGSGATVGAGLGSFVGPIGTAAGGIIGGGLGFAGGMLGFDLAADAGTDTVNQALGNDYKSYLRAPDQYLKDFAYNAGQGTFLEGATVPLKLARGTIRSVKNPFTQAGTEGQVAATLEKLEPGYGAKVNEALARAEGDPFLEQKSLGELIGSDTIKNAERVARQSDVLGTARTKEVLRNDAQLKYLDQLESSSLTPEDVQASIKGTLDDAVAAKQRDVNASQDIVDTAVGNLAAPIEVSEAGGMIREGVQSAKDALRSQVNAKFEGIGEGTVDPTRALQTAAELMPKYFKEVGAQPSAELQNLVGSLVREPEATGLLDAQGAPIVRNVPFTLRDVQALRSKALDIANGADARTATVAGKIADALKQAGDDAVKTGKVSLEEIQNWKDGISLRKKQGEIFESSATPAKTVLAKQPYGEFRVPESAVPSKYFKPGSKGVIEAIDNYKKTVGASEQALEPIYRYATDSLRNYAIKDGKVDIKKYRKWMSDHSAALEQLPDLKNQFSSVEKAQSFLNERFGDLTRSQLEAEKGALSYILRVDADKAIPAMLSGKDMIKRTMRTVQYVKQSDPDALAGLRRGVIEHLKKKSYIADAKTSLEEASLPGGETFDGTVRGGVLKSEWEKIRPAIDKSGLFTESQLKGFDYLYRDKSSQLSVGKTRTPGESSTFQNFSTLAALSSIGKTFLSRVPLGGKIIPLVQKVLEQIPEQRFNDKLLEALLNPRVARDLSAKATAKNFTRAAETIFGEELSKAFGGTLPTGVTNPPGFTPPEKKFTVPKQEQITSQQTFPDPNKVLRPPMNPGSAKKVSFNVKDYIAKQSPETRARIATESSGDPFAVSPKGAQGLAQLMPGTGQEMAAELGETYTPLRPGMSPEEQAFAIDQNVRLGDRYYQKQLGRFKNPSLAWAAYNAGPGRVEEAIKLAGSSRDVNKVLANLPKGVQKETVPYVRKIIERLT